MSIYSGLFIVAIALILGDVTALSKEEKEGIKEVLVPIITECAKENDVSMEELKALKESHSSEGLSPCYLACIFKKTKIMDDAGKFDVAEAKKKGKKFLHDEADIKKSDDTADDCASVNDAEVSDGDKGCERAKLLAACLAQHKKEELLI